MTIETLKARRVQSLPGSPVANTIYFVDAGSNTFNLYVTNNDGTIIASALVDAGDVPAGGTFGQVLAKASGTDYDTEWVTAIIADNSGNVGIGTSSPTQALTVVGDIDLDESGTDSYLRQNGEIVVGRSDNSNFVRLGSSDASDYIRFFSGGSERMRLDTSGNVGIGTTSVPHTLTVSGTVGADYFSPRSNQTDPNDGSAYIYQLQGVGWDFAALNLRFSTGGSGARSERMRITNSGNVGIGTTSPSEKLDVSGNVTISGSLSKGSGSFKIDHPIKPDTHHLVHSFIEGPQADNIYRGKVALVGGTATVNLDEAGRMTEGTFVALNGNVQCFTTNEDGWTAVRGKVDGNILTIEAQDTTCTDTVSWLVIGERHDQHMIDANWTDEQGRIITEPEKGTKQ